MTTVKEAIRMLNDHLDQDEEICIAWWAKELFEGAFDADIKEEAWAMVVNEFDDMTIYPQELIYNQIVQTLDDNKGWVENE
ncbi:MAG: hypothetical protein RLZZ184_1514 [Cyanobacteriota bacterium]|jgi:hypothetical protein